MIQKATRGIRQDKVRQANIKHTANHISDEEEEEDQDSDAETESDEDRAIQKPVYHNVWSDDSDNSDQFDEDSEADLDRESPLKRKRLESMSEFFDIPDDDDESINEHDLAALADSEDESDIENFENRAVIQEEEDKEIKRQKYHTLDNDHPFAYAPDDDSDKESNSDEIWVADFETLDGISAFDHNTAADLTKIETESPDEALEEEFFLTVVSDDDEESADEAEITFTFGLDDDDDRVGWECFFSDGHDSDLEEIEEETDVSTDDEKPALLSSKHEDGLKTPAPKPTSKSGLTSVVKQSSMQQESSPHVVSSTPVKLNTSHQPPVLGTWTRDKKRATGIIDGMTTHSPVGLPPPSILKKSSKSKPQAYARSEAMTAAMTSLDDIMYTNDFLAGTSPELASQFDKPIQVGAFRRGQQRGSLMREDSLKDEWYIMTAKNKAKPGRTRATPILGVASESLSRKEKRRRKKMKLAGGSSISGSLFGGSIDETSDFEDDGVERAGLGFGPPVESLFLFHV